MNRRVLVLASILLAACGGASPAPPPCGPPADQMAAAGKQIEAVASLGDELLKRGDIPAVAALFAPDGAFLEANREPVLGRAAIQADLQPLAGRVKDVVVTPWEVEVYGDVASYIGDEVFTLVGGGGFRGKNLNIFKRQPDGSWLVYRDIFQGQNPDAKPADAPVAAATSTPRASASAPCPATPSDPATVRRQIEQTEARNVEALKRGDAPAYAAAFALDGAYLSSSVVGPVRGRAAIAALLQPGLAEPGDRELTVREVEVYGGTAYEMGTELVTRPHVKYHTRFVALWRQQPDGAWLIFRRIDKIATEQLTPREAP